MSIRARTIVYHKDRVKPESLSTYEDLADTRWKGRLCLRTSKKVYNQSLVAMMMARLGEKKTEEVVKGWVANLATKVFSNDTSVKKDPKLPLKLFWPNQKDRGVHVNVSGAAVTAHAKNRKGAIAFLEWLSGEQAQSLFADANMEYPVNSKIKPNQLVQQWGTFRKDDMNLARAGELQAKAVMLMDRAGYK
jgi:iron(III) transport system substrate-binding protein